MLPARWKLPVAAHAMRMALLAGVLVGQLGVTLPNEVKQCFFLLFLFAIGFRTGPQFFRGLKSDGLQHAALAAIVAVTGLLVAWLVVALLPLQPFCQTLNKQSVQKNSIAR